MNPRKSFNSKTGESKETQTTQHMYQGPYTTLFYQRWKSLER